MVISPQTPSSALANEGLCTCTRIDTKAYSILYFFPSGRPGVNGSDSGRSGVNRSDSGWQEVNGSENEKPQRGGGGVEGINA